MSNKNSYIYDGVLLTVGANISLSRHGSEHGWGEEGERMTIVCIKAGGSRLEVHIGLKASYPHENDDWHNLDGLVPQYQGRWFSPQDILHCFNIPGKDVYYIQKDLEVRGRNLRDMSCRILSYSNSNSVFVEFEEDIGGCGADGLGRKGHCLLVEGDILGVRSVSKKDQKKKAKEGGIVIPKQAIEPAVEVVGEPPPMVTLQKLDTTAAFTDDDFMDADYEEYHPDDPDDHF